MPADLCTLEDILIEEEKLEKENSKKEDREQLFMEKMNSVKTHEENVKILEDAIHESLGNTVTQCE